MNVNWKHRMSVCAYLLNMQGCNEPAEWCLQLAKEHAAALDKDAVEVIRCKDCAHWVTNAGHLWCEMWEGVMKDPDFFCADGERKAQE